MDSTVIIIIVVVLICISISSGVGFALSSSSSSGSWTLVYSNDSNDKTDLGQSATDALFASSKIIKRVCSDCNAANSLIFYKRTSNIPPSFSIYNNIKNLWASTNNILGTDFKMYGSLTDIKSDTNSWTFCNYDDIANQIGGFRDCNPNPTNAGGQWNSLKLLPSRTVKYYVLVGDINSAS